MADLLERLRTKGWRLTPQRRVVAEVLRGQNVHLSAEAVHAGARELLPEISLATVYNTLRELVAMGEVIEVSAGTGPKRYDPNAHDRHHHLVCEGCNTVMDVHPDGAAGLRLADPHGFELAGVQIVFHGRCPECQTSQV